MAAPGYTTNWKINQKPIKHIFNELSKYRLKDIYVSVEPKIIDLYLIQIKPHVEKNLCKKLFIFIIFSLHEL
jgi:hypothetical protein